MIPSKSKRSDSRRSSILKPRKPRQPLQSVNFDSSSNENSPAASKVRRRVSFAEKKHVKEFCHSTEQGTVWDNTYEEHDVSLKGSFDQKAEAESKEKASLSAPNNDCTCIHSESNLCYPNNTYLVNNQLSQESITGANEENNDTNCDLDFIDPVNSIELSNISQLECAALTSKSCVSRDAVLSGIVAYSDSDEDCMPEEKSQSEQITNISKNIKSSNIMIYRDSDEEDCTDNVPNKYHSESCSNNVDSELDKMHVQDLSMELTAPISTSLLSSHLHTEEQKGEGRNKDTNYTINYNNVSMEITEAIPIFAKSVASNLEVSKQIPKILHSYENRKGDAANICNTIFSTNLQSNIVSKNFSEHMPDVNYANDSMVLTSTIPTLTDLHVTSTDIRRTNNTAFDTSMEMVIVPSKLYEEKANNESIVKRNDRREDKTVIFNDVPMEMTKPIGTTLFPNVCNQENFRVADPISRDDGTMFFHNVSMEMTRTVSTKNRQEVTDTITCKSLSEENAHSGKDVNISACFNEETKILCKSMEFTEAVPVSLYHEKMFHAAHIAQSNKSTCENHENDRTEFFNDASMEITKSVVNTIPFNIDKENLKIDESVSKNDKTILFHNVSMEMTTAMSARNEKEITQPIQLLPCKSISEESTHGEKDTNNSTYFNEGTKLFCKSMEFTEIVPISSHDERTFDTTDTPRATQSTSFSRTSKAISVPAENSAGVVFQVDAIANETIHDVSMEITAAVPSTLHFPQDTKVNKENLIIPKNDGFQHPITNNDLTKLRENVIKENFTISREIVETEDIRHDELSNVTQSRLDNLDHSLSANLENASGKKRTSDENERSCSKRVCSSFTEVESSQENDVHLFPSTSVNYVNNVKRNECFVTDIVDHTQVPGSDLRDSLNEISKYSFIRKSLPYLENSPVELQSIKPPSFVCLDSEEENSFRGIQHEPQPSTITDVPINNTSNRLIINNSIESKYLINSRESVTNDYFAILREKEETINTEGNKTEDCHKSTIMEKTDDNLEKETNCQVITKTIVNDNRLNKSMNYTKNINEESILSMNAKNGRPVTVQDINHCTSLIIKEIEVIDEDQTNERECVRKRINEDAKLENNIEEKRRYLDRKRQETEKCSNHPEDTGAAEDQIDPKEHEQNLNDEVKQQSMEQKDECAAGELVTAHVTTIDVKNGSFTEQDPFLTLLQKLETYGAREDCIWSVYYTDINKKMIVFGFISSSLLIATFLSDDFNGSEKNLIKRIKVVSRISDETGVLIKIVHKLILEKINAEILENLYTTHQDILPMLNFISQDVKLAMDFMFDLRRLDDLNLMEIARDEISFISQSKRMDIILRVTIKVKRFDKLTRNDINFYCLLGKVKETDIKDLIKNVKRDHKFLRRYMNDVKDYIDIMEETFK